MSASSSSPVPLLNAVASVDLSVQRLSSVESITLLQALSAVPDPRRRRGRRHSLQSILLIAVGAVLAGARSYAAIADWAATAEQALRMCGRAPHASTIRRVLAAVDPGALQAALTGWVLARHDILARQQAAHLGPARQQAAHLGPARERRRVLAVDGKTLRGARDETGQQDKLVCVYDSAFGLVLTQTAVVDGDELAAFSAVLNTLPDLRDVLVTADALHCQRGHAAYLAERGGHYLFTVKGNQPSLRRALAALPWHQVPTSRSRGTGHGRTETRSMQVLDLDHQVGNAGRDDLFPGAARALRIRRRRRRNSTGATTTETVYAITSLTYRDADPALLAAWIRGHWGIENAVHWVRDVTQGEDHSRIRTGSGPPVMAALRNTAINLARLAGHSNIAGAQRRYSWQRTAALDAITAA